MSNCVISWRLAEPSDDDVIVGMCEALFIEDPSPQEPGREQMHRTLRNLRENPGRGCAVVLEVDQAPQGYAFLVSFWSNEFGGEVCVIDELYVCPPHRKQGFGRAFLESLKRPSPVWNRQAVALWLEVTPENGQAHRLYSSLGFRPAKNSVLQYKVAP